MRMRYFLCFLAMTTVFAADQGAENTAASPEMQNQLGIEQKEPATSPSPAPGGENQRNTNPEPLQRFVPKERIPAGSAISFPTDI